MVHSKRARRLIFVVLVIWALFVLFPLYWMVTVSLKDGRGLLLGATFLPWVDFDPSLDAWMRVIAGRTETIKSLINSATIGVVSSAAATLIGGMAGYGLARFQYKLGPLRNRDLAFFLVSQRILPPVVLVIPIFLLFQRLQLLDSRLGLIILYTVFNLPIAGWLMHDYFKQIPTELDDAALVDGATPFQAFWKVSLPLARPGIFATFLISLIFAWNEFFFALVLTFNEARTLPILVASQATQHGPEWESIAAMGLITALPLVLLTAVVGNRLLKGLMAGWTQ